MGNNMRVVRLDVVALGLTAMLSMCMSAGRLCSPEVDVRYGRLRSRGVWKAPCDSNLADASLDISKLDFKDIEKARGQMNV